MIFFYNLNNVPENINYPDIYFTHEYGKACEYSDDANWELCQYKDLIYVYLKKEYIFEDIKYIIKDKRGIFVSKRNLDSFSKTVKYIMQNYYEIQKDIEKNSLPTKKSMLKQISDILR